MLLMQMCLIGPFVIVALWARNAGTAVWCGGVLALVSFPFLAPFAIFTGLGLLVVGVIAAIFTSSHRARVAVITVGMGLVWSPMLYSAWDRAVTASSLQSQYAYVSLQDRVTPVAPPVLLPEASESMQLQDRRRPSYRGRVYAIQAVHRTAVYHFLNSPDFGVGRMRYPGLRQLEEPDGAPIRIPLQSEYHLVSAPLQSQVDPATSQSFAAKPITGSDAEEISRGHKHYSSWFLSPDRFGDVKDVSQVAGFLPHAITEEDWPYPTGSSQVELDRPFHSDGSDSDQRERLTLRKLQMVGLLYHETPVVYDLETLPELLSADTAPTRSLDSFESRAIEILKGGTSVHIENVPGGVRMLGALRNAESCTDCHDGPTNQLLGAFSYELALK
jgi:hypothetical protein